jgi:hypothetical protein
MANFINSAEILSAQRSPSIVHFQFTAADLPSTARRNFVLPVKAGTMLHSIKQLISQGFGANSKFNLTAIRAVGTVNGVASRPVAVNPLALTAAQIETLVGGGTITDAVNGVTYSATALCTADISLVTGVEATPPFVPTVVSGSAMSYAPADQLFVVSLQKTDSAPTVGVLKLFLELSNVKLDGIKAGLLIADQAAE